MIQKLLNKFWNWKPLWSWYYGDSVSAFVVSAFITGIKWLLIYMAAIIFITIIVLGFLGFALRAN